MYYTSPAKRATQTHKHSADVMGVDAEAIEDDLLQELDWGDWTGKRRSLYDEDSTQLAIVMDGNDWHAPGGESVNQVAGRVQQFLDSLEKAVDPDADEYVWVYTHRGAIRSYIGSQLGWPYPQIYGFTVPTASRTRLVKANGLWQIEFIGEPSV
jgi:probable phosphoglycerate mutase